MNRRMYVFVVIGGSCLQLNIASGFGVLNCDRTIYAFTNLLNGVDLFSSITLTHQCSIAHSIDRYNNLALGLVVTEYVIVGGIGGAIWIYDRNTRTPMACLQNPSSSGALPFGALTHLLVTVSIQQQSKS